MLDKYRDYFDIDPEYFPQINEKVINNNPDIWKKFYPHETFINASEGYCKCSLQKAESVHLG